MTSPDTSGLTRRETLAGIGASLLATPAFAQLAVPSPADTAAAAYAYVGSFTSAERKARGNGINVFNMDTTTGAWNHVQHVGELVNPSFLVLSKNQRAL